MAHADALSRSIAYIDELPLERQLEFLQLSDPRILEISKQLELAESEKFDLIDGLVYRKTENQPKFYVPDSMIISILRAYHDTMAHYGVEKTYHSIKQNYWFPTM